MIVMGISCDSIYSSFMKFWSIYTATFIATVYRLYWETSTHAHQQNYTTAG